MSNLPNHNYCLNCNAELFGKADFEKEVFCSKCGQSNKESRLSIIKLLADGISNIFNLDSRLIHTFRDIIYPGKLTQTYIEGKRKYYVNPVRLFIFLLIGGITLALWITKLENYSFGSDVIHSRSEKSTMLKKYDQLVDTLDFENKAPITDSIRVKLFKNVKLPENDSIGKGNNIQLFGLNKKVEDYGISSYDAVHLSPEEIVSKYSITDFWEKQFAKQYIRIIKNPANSIIFAIKNLTWAVLITIILVSLFLKLLFIRRNHYIVEHVVLLLNLHSFLIAILAIIALLNAFIYPYFTSSNFGLDDVIDIGLILFTFVVQFISLRRYYQMGFFRTLLYQFMINFTYFFIFCFSAIFVGFISVLLY